MLADSLSKYGNQLINNGEYDSAINILAQSIRLNRYLKRKWEFARDQNDIGTAFHRNKQYDSAILYYTHAKAGLIQIGDTLILPMALTNIGILFKRKGRYEEALESIFTALKFDLSKRTKASAYNTIGSAYTQTNQYDLAIKYYSESLKYYQELGNRRRIGMALNNLGNLYNKLELYDSAISCFERTIEIKKEVEDQTGISKTLNNLGLTYLDLNDFDHAEKFLSESLKLKTQLNDSLGIANTLNLVSRINLRNGELRKAKENLDLANEIIVKEEALYELRENLKQQAEYFQLANEWNHKAEMLEQYISINDSLLDQEKARALAEMQVKYDSDKKDREISYLQKVEELQKIDISFQKRIIKIISVAAVLLLMLLSIIIYLFRTNTKKKVMIEELNQEMQHRVKNNLQILSGVLKLQTEHLEDFQAITALKIGESRVNAMALIHQLLYHNQGTQHIKASNYIGELLLYLKNSFLRADNKIEVRQEIEEAIIDVDQMVSIGLIINELVTNAIKHAFSMTSTGIIQVKFKSLDDNRLFLEVADNGIGVKTSTLGQPETFGMKLVNMLSRQLNAEFSSFNKNGAVFQFSIPSK